MARRPFPALATLALVGVLFLAGCGVQAAAFQPPVTTLHVMRTSAFPQNHISPFERTGTDAAKVAHLYATLLALPDLPQNLHCPADFGVVYHLTFFKGTTPTVQATVDASGCGRVTMEHHVRWWASDTAFWQQFADALGVQLSAVYPVVPQSSGPSAPTSVPTEG